MINRIITLSLAGLLLAAAGCTPARHSVGQGRAGYYREQHRPQYHFTPESGWMNDPNGLVYYQGEYHLFYQHNPASTVWGPMHWGHAVSRDLVHWEHLPIALYPDSLGYIFSGSVVIDENNTSGFAPPGSTEKALVAIFTYHNMEYERAGRQDRESQAIAYSLDRGRTWTKYAGNPVLPNKGDVDFRDPKVTWHEPTKRWIMPLAVGDYLEIFVSPDLKKWEYASTFGKNEGAHGGVWECPDLFPLLTREGAEKWVLIQNMGRGAVNGGSGTQYFIGSFDGRTFKNDNPPQKTLWLDYGADNYAGVTYFNAPDNRRILIGWMSNWFDYAQSTPTSTWRSSMTIPRDLWLQYTPEGYRLFQKPSPELKSLVKNTRVLAEKVVEKAGWTMPVPVLHELDLQFDMTTCSAAAFGYKLKNSRGEQVVMTVNVRQKTVTIDRSGSGKTSFSAEFPKKHSAPVTFGGVFRMHAYADASSLELFLADGAACISETFFPNEDFNEIEFFAEDGSVTLLPASSVNELKPVWNKQK